MLMQSYVVETVDQPLLNNTCLVCSRGKGFYANYRGQRSPSVFSLVKQYITVNWLLCTSFLMNNIIMVPGYKINVCIYKKEHS